MIIMTRNLAMLIRVAMTLALAGVLVACGDEEEDVATEDLNIPEISPESQDEVSQGVEEVSLTIVDGAFSEDELVLQQLEPSVVIVTNEDDTAYQFRIEDLVSSQEIPASSETNVEFTTPNAGTYTGELLSEDGETVLAEITVDVVGTGGVDD